MQRLWNHPVLRWIPPLVWMGIIYFLSAQSQLPDLTPGAPKLQEIGGHLTVFFVLAFLWALALAKARVSTAGLWAFSVAVLYGASDEIHQSYVPGRTCDPVDLIVDIAGASLALLAAAALCRLIAARHGKPA
jgi:VanZ family protein